MTRLLPALAVVIVGACQTSAGSQAAPGGSGGAGGGGGAAGAGGQDGAMVVSPPAGGAGGCSCPGAACSPGIEFFVTAATDAGAGSTVIGELSVTSPGLTVTCQKNRCDFQCRVTGSTPNGSYVFTLSAPGYVPQSLTVPVKHPVPGDCGCCPCCGFSYSARIALVPNGMPITGCCDTSSDPKNCGRCGRVCRDRAGPLNPGICQQGMCAPTLVACIAQSSGFTTCDQYCASIGESCVPEGCSGSTRSQWAVADDCQRFGTPTANIRGACGDPIPFGANPVAVRCCCTNK